ncbi:MAG: hypothetical protein JSV25_13150 [Spirochaetota bacterium]|nr:MAG: hypothetical protein JSV25_13150 [Spirochaetota bacterium]
MKRKILLYILSVPIMLFLSLLLVSCPSQISEDILLQAKDETGPVITITSPQDGSPYSTVVEVSGTATDRASENGDMGGIKSVYYEVLATTIKGEIFCSGDGFFCFDFSTSGLSGSLVVKINAIDWNENSGSASITLIDTDSDIPSFTATAENHKITLNWDPVPLAESYTLYYTTNNSYPNIGQGGTNGFVRNNVLPGEMLTADEDGNPIQNGSMHILQLMANLPDGYEDAWSGFVKVVPLSRLSLAPVVSTNKCGQVSLWWKEIAINEYEVWRSKLQDEEVFFNLTGTISENSYTDKTAEDGKNFYYRVKPSSCSSVDSFSVPGQTSPTIDKVTGTYDTGLTSTSGVDIKVEADNTYAYIADYYGKSMTILNISNPATPMLESDIVFPNYPASPGYDVILPTDVVVAEYNSKDYAFVTDRYCGLQIVDISNPASPVLEKQVNIIYYPTNDCRIQGNYVYLAARGTDTEPLPWHGCGWLQVVDLDEVMADGMDQYLVHSETPTGTGEYQEITCYIDDHSVWGLDVEGDFAYLACDDAGIKIIDISVPAGVTDASLIDSCDTPGNAHAVDVGGSYAYVADYSEGLQVIDINPAHTGTYLTIVGSCKTQNVARDVCLVYPYAYIADCFGGVATVDVSDPTDPTIFYTYSTPGSALDVVFDGDYIYVADSDRGFHIIDDSESFIKPAYLGSHESETLMALDVDVAGDYAYVADGRTGLQIIDINEDHVEYLSVIGFCETPGKLSDFNYWSTLSNYGFGVDVVGDYAFFADRVEGLQVIDVNPDHTETYLTIIGSAETPGQAWDVEVYGDYAFVANWDAGLEIIDVSNPNDPVLKAEVRTSCYSRHVHLEGNLAYLAGNSMDLEIIDISDPLNPIHLSSCLTLGSSWDVDTSGDYAYVCCGWKGGPSELQILDVSDPLSPVLVYSMPLNAYGLVFDVDIAGDYAYVATGESAAYYSYLLVIDITDPVRPRVRGSYRNQSGSEYEITYYSRALKLVGDHVYKTDLVYLLKDFRIERKDKPE